jgi:VanZ family protein
MDNHLNSRHITNLFILYYKFVFFIVNNNNNDSKFRLSIALHYISAVYWLLDRELTIKKSVVRFYYRYYYL